MLLADLTLQQNCLIDFGIEYVSLVKKLYHLKYVDYYNIIIIIRTNDIFEFFDVLSKGLYL